MASLNPLFHTPLTLLGGLTSAQFMRQYWQRQPLVVRGAFSNEQLAKQPHAQILFDLACQDDVASRLVIHDDKTSQWTLEHGPFEPDDLPPTDQAGWTLLVQGVDRHHPWVHQCLQQFRFIPDARLDDIMISWASPQGGVGPHEDSYDVFLIQMQGQRRWQIAAPQAWCLQEGVPLKLIEGFEAEQTWVLHPGDMLYLPPKWAHDGVALASDDGAACMTYSVGFRAPNAVDLAAELVYRMADELQDSPLRHKLYQDKRQTATPHPALIPSDLQRFAEQSLTQFLKESCTFHRVLGEWLSEPHAITQFPEGQNENLAFDPPFDLPYSAWQLHPATKVLYDHHNLYVNGYSYKIPRRLASVLIQLANDRYLPDTLLLELPPSTQQHLTEQLHDWQTLGWITLCVK